VATVLDAVKLGNFAHWNMVILAAWMFFAGRFVSVGGAVWSLLPSIVLYSFLFFIIHYAHP